MASTLSITVTLGGSDQTFEFTTSPATSTISTTTLNGTGTSDDETLTDSTAYSIIPSTIPDNYEQTSIDCAVDGISTGDNTFTTGTTSVVVCTAVYTYTPTNPSQYSNQTLVFQDIGKTQGDNTEIDNLVQRADQDASTKLEAIFLNNIDFDGTNGWFTDLATRLTTAIFWHKSNGTTEAKENIEKILAEARATNIERFFPSEVRY